MLNRHIDTHSFQFCNEIDSPCIKLDAGGIGFENTAFEKLALSFNEKHQLTQNIHNRIKTELLKGQIELAQGNFNYFLIDTSSKHDELNTHICILKPVGVNSLPKRYSNLVNAIQRMSEGVVILNSNHQVDFANQSFYKLFPYFTKQALETSELSILLKQAIDSIVADESKQRAMLRLLNRKISNNAPINISFKNKENRYIEYRDNISEDGERIGLFIDESSIMFLHEQLELAYTESLSLSKAKSSFMAAMSHEVKTPLNAMIGILDLCMRDENISQSEYVIRLNKSANHLLRLVNDVLDYTKFDAERVNLNAIASDVRELFEQCLSEHADSAQLKNTELLLYVDPQLPEQINVDDIRLSQVLNNLISNAIKFGNKKKNFVSVSVKLAEPSRMIISVSDNGIGVPKDKINTIFDNFTQASDEIHRTFGGTGLGLSICKQITSLMNGKIFAQSQEGKGSRFIVDITIEPLGKSFQEVLTKQQTKYDAIVTDDKLMYFMLEKYQKNIDIPIRYDNQALNKAKPNNLTITKHQAEIPKRGLSHIRYIKSRNSKSNSLNELFISKTPLRLSEILSALSIQKSCLMQTEPNIHSKSQGIKLNFKVLFVEDNPDNLFVLKEQAKTLELDAQFAQTVKEAFQFCAQINFDIIITDYQMQGETGADLIRLLYSNSPSFKTKFTGKIYVLTADKTQECEDDCKRAGADAILMKPISIASLNQLLMSHCSVADNQQESAQVEAFASEYESELTVNEDNCLFSAQTLLEVLGSEDVNELKEFLKMYMQNINNALEQLQHAVDILDINQIASLSHSMKSSFKIIGGQAMLLNCERIESCVLKPLNAQLETDLRARFEKLNEQFEQSNEQINTWIENEIY